MKKLEKTFIIMILLSAALSLSLISGGGILFTISMLSLSMLYLVFGFALCNGIGFRGLFKKRSYRDTTFWRIAGGIAIGHTLSLTIIGILFAFMFWEGAMIMLRTSMLTWLLVSIVILIRYFRSPDRYARNALVRLSIWGLIGMIFLFTPTMTWVKIQYRAHPAYIKALEAAYADRDNDALWQKVKEEHEKTFK